MRSSWIALAAVLSVSFLGAPARARQAAGNTSSLFRATPRVAAVLDHQRESAVPGAKRKAASPGSSIQTGVFPNFAIPAEGLAPGGQVEPAVAPRITAPPNRAPAAPQQQQFSPRLRPPNGKTDGKIYAA